MKCITLQHLAFEDLGIFEKVLKDHGFDLEYRQAGQHPLTLREWTDADLVIVLGGPIGVYEADKYPWLLDEIDGVKLRLSLKKPIIGICLGAQIMAAALGAPVYPGTKEIGWSELILTQEAALTPLRHLEGAPVLHWHGDTFDLPQGATLLASTKATRHQAFVLGDYALATQFHVEVDGKLIEKWLIGHTCELSHAGISIPALRQETEKQRARAAAAGMAMLKDWLLRLSR